MDELIQILFTIGFILFATISGMRKRARQAEAEEGSAEEHRPEGWSPQSPAQELRPAAAPARPKRMPQQSTMHPDSREELISEIAALQRDERPGRGASRPQHPTHGHSGTPGQASANEAAAAEKHPLTADFDARKAVIWSEILKPKFDEH